MLKDALSQMTKVFSPAKLMEGRAYQQRGYVLNVRLSDGLIKARIKSQLSQIFDVHIDLKIWPKQPARCSCQQSNCAHAVASLLAMQHRENMPSSMLEEPLFSSWDSSAEESHYPEKKSKKSHDLFYLVEPQKTAHDDRFILRLALAKQLKKGGHGKKIIVNNVPDARKQFFSKEDEAILSALMTRGGGSGGHERFIIRNSDLLSEILLTKRALLFSSEKNLILDKTVAADLTWQLTIEGTQQLRLKKAEEMSIFLLDNPWYFDEKNGKLGLLKTSYSTAQLRMIFSLNPSATDPQAWAELRNSLPSLPSPTVYQAHQKQQITPVPVLCFDAIERQGEEVAFYSMTASSFLFTLTLFFDYQGIRVRYEEPMASLFQEQETMLIEKQRHLTFEKNCLKECETLLPSRRATIAEKLNALDNLNDQSILIHYQTDNDLMRLHQQVIPLIQKKGWQVEFNHPIYGELIDSDAVEWFSDVEEKNNHFFSYQLGILIDGKPISIVPLIVKLIGHFKHSIDEEPDDKRMLWHLPNGKRLQFTLGRIKPLMRFLLQYNTLVREDETRLHINRYQLLLMQESERAIASSNLRWFGADKLRQQMQVLINKEGWDEIALPLGLKAVLRDYQHQGLNWLQFLRENHLGGVLADDMGLGKTVQTLAHLQCEKENGRMINASLIIAPTSLVGNWYEEASRFTPSLRVGIFHGNLREQTLFANYDVLITTYGLVQRDKEAFIHYPFYYLILDEAQSIKNARAKTTQIIQQLQAEHRLCLSGTPLENHLGELWSLFHFLMPGLLGDIKQFRRFFKTPIEKYQNEERQKGLSYRVSPFMLRRTKAQVERELPPKTDIIQMVELEGPQRDLYEVIRISMEKKVRAAIARLGLNKSHIVLLDALLKLRQVCCDPRLLSIPEAQIAHGTSAKLTVLMSLLDSLVAEKRRVLVFSQFTSMLALIEEELRARHYPYLILTGKTQQRQRLVHVFQQGEIPIFLISLKAGGTGLNLTRADTVIHYDPWWNPAAQEQATDRSHRIGQEKPVFVYKLISSGTVEEAILAMQTRKKELFDGILSDNLQKLSGITSTDIEHFFMPLD